MPVSDKVEESVPTMEGGATARVVIPLEETDYLRTAAVQIAHDRSRAENFFVRSAIVAVCVSPVVVYLMMCAAPDQSTAVIDVFERWLTVMGPLLGAAFGVGVVTRKGRE